MNASIDDKLDTLLVSTTQLAERQGAMLTRMDKVESSAAKMESFVDKCNLGRRVLLWALSVLGSGVALLLAAYNTLLKP
jgi:hypothetical protein